MVTATASARASRAWAASSVYSSRAAGSCGPAICYATQQARPCRAPHLLGGLQAIPITEPVARVHADIWSDLAQRGTVIGAHDLWIAATALAHGLGVATRNAELRRVAGLRVVAAA